MAPKKNKTADADANPAATKKAKAESPSNANGNSKDAKEQGKPASATATTKPPTAEEFLRSAAASHTTNSNCCTGAAIDSKECALSYMPGFGAEHISQALPGVILHGQITPHKCPYNLIAEQLSGTSFTTPRVFNQRTWFYRIAPAAKHTPFKPIKHDYIVSDFSNAIAKPDQIRWKPFPLPSGNVTIDFLEGWKTLGGHGSPDAKSGFAIHIYTANVSMKDKALCNADGDLLIVPQQGDLHITTECGKIHLKPNEIAVIPRGHKFSVGLAAEGEAVRGYICEVYNGHFRIPDLGPIGANGLANPKDFQVPVAWYEDRKCKYTVVHKFCGKLFAHELDASPFDVVGWFGNYVPYKFDLAHYIAVNSVTRDHLDPSIFTVLTCQTTEIGVASVDFVIFPPRWAVQESTFRPPYYHRNCMTEFMGNIRGRYEAKPEGFLPGGGSLHSCMSGHGPDADTYERASAGGGVDPAALNGPSTGESSSSATVKPEAQKPVRMPDDSMSFMFESTYIMKLTEWGAGAPVDTEYWKCWSGLKREFNPNQPIPTKAPAATAATAAAK